MVYWSMTYYPIASFKAEIWHKVEESVPKQSGTIALHKSFSQGKYCTNYVCLFQPIKCKHLILRFYLNFWLPLALVTHLKWLLQGSNVAKAEEYIPKQVCQHSTAQVIVTGKIRRVLHVNFECLFWPIKCMHSKPRFWVHFGH